IIDAVSAYLLRNMAQTPSQIAALFFMGDSGTGKTSLAYRIGHHRSGERATVRLDCSQLIDPWGSTSLLGSYPGLVWSDRSSFLSIVRTNPYATLIFDEIEKAHMAIIRLFLQILSEPYCIRDNRGVKLDFSKSLIIFTSNIGHSSADHKKVGFSKEAIQENQTSANDDTNHARTLVRYFPEEFIGRLKNHIYRFQPLDGGSQKKIIEIEIARRAHRLGLIVEPTAGVTEFLLEKADVDLFGVRSIHAVVSRWIDPILEQLNEEHPAASSVYRLVIKNNKITSKKHIRFR
ncbi:ATP-dependent Clp protease ATP-binding subunit, partial [candidate division KSB1 bacterium]|nr:ATP-dependent Clp protease ATP-binding subunit [candidate division KSB1 bacterium]